MKHFHIPLIAALTFAGSAWAQSAWNEIEDGLLVVDPLGMTVDELDDVRIDAPDGEHVGRLDDVLMAREDESIGFLLDVGGYLGSGEKNVLIPAEKLSAHADGLTLDMTKAEIEALPEYID